MGVAVRLAAVRDALVLAGVDGIALRRATISPSAELSAGLWGDQGVQVLAGVHYRKEPPRRRQPGLRSRAADVATSKGFLGCAVVFHPWRDRQTWRFNVRGPHFHVVGPARWLEEGDGGGGWLFKASNARLEVGSVYDRLAYDLTHVAVTPGRPVVAYCGAVHPQYRAGRLLDERTRGRIDALEGGRLHVCPKCASTNTHSVIPEPEELYRWGIIRPLEKRHRHQVTQHRFADQVLADQVECDDCGAEWLEPLKEPKPPALQRIERPGAFRRR